MLDTDLAAALGMSRDRDIRSMIRDNGSELESFGTLRAAAAKSTGGRPGTAYHLNEEQALLICMLSRTERAKQVASARDAGAIDEARREWP